MKKLFVILLSAVMVFGLVACGESSTSTTTNAAADAATDDLQYVKDKGTLIVGITDFEPMDYKDESGNWIGFDADLAKAYAESIGVEAKFVEIDWDSKTMELANKNIDVVWNGMTIMEELKSTMSISEAYCKNAQVVVVNKDMLSQINSVEDCMNLSFTVEAGSAGEDVAKENGFNYTAVGTQADAVLEVSAGTSQACIIDLLMAQATVGEGTSYDNLVTTDIQLSEEYYGIGARLDSNLNASLNEFIQTARTDGTIDQLAAKYNITANVIK